MSRCSSLHCGSSAIPRRSKVHPMHPQVSGCSALPYRLRHAASFFMLTAEMGLEMGGCLRSPVGGGACLGVATMSCCPIDYVITASDRLHHHAWCFLACANQLPLFRIHFYIFYLVQAKEAFCRENVLHVILTNDPPARAHRMQPRMRVRFCRLPRCARGSHVLRQIRTPQRRPEQDLAFGA